MKKLIILIIGMLFAGNLFAATYTFDLYGMRNVGGIDSPKVGTTERLDNRAQSFMLSLSVSASFSTSDCNALKQDLQTMINAYSGTGLSVTNAQAVTGRNGRLCQVTFAVTANNSGANRTFQFSCSPMGQMYRVTFLQTPKIYFDISPSEIYILPNRTYTFTLSGSTSGKTYSLRKNDSQVSTKTGNGSALTFPVTYGELSAGVVDLYTIKEGDQEFNGCTMIYYDEIAKKRYQAPKASYDVAASGGNIVVRCEWPGSNNIGQLFNIIDQMNKGSYSYAWDNQSVQISVADYDVSSYCILNFTVSPHTGTTSRIFYAPFIFNNGSRISIKQTGQDPLKKQQNWVTHTRYNTASGDSKTISTTYFDGLKRPIQDVQAGAAADQSNKDIINIIRYDAMGRDNSTVYLPYATQQQYAGGYDANAIEAQKEYYNAVFGDDGNYAYTETQFEQSALNRVVSQTKIGKVYRDQLKQTNYTYATNAENEVFRIVADSAGMGFSVNGYFAKSSLYKINVTDEDGNTRIAFYNSDNQLVLERKINDGNNLDTYFTYDEFERVTNTISPQASRVLTNGVQYTVNSEMFANFCYGYIYDYKGNITTKKLPGKEVEHFVYDKGGRLVMYQDGVMRTTNYWAFTVYDCFNNLVSNKVVECVNTQMNRGAIQQKFDAEAACRSVDYNTPANSFMPYSGFNTDFTEIAMLAEAKYYGLDSESVDSAPAALAFKDVVNIASSKDVKENTGKKRYEKLKYLDGGSLSTNSGNTERAFYYDAKGRLLQKVEQHPTGALSRYSYQYDFNGNMVASQEAHTVNGRTDSLNSRHNIYNGGQLTSSIRNLNNSIEATINYTKNALGKMVSKDYGSAANNLTETYKYNIQGWLTEQSCERFTSRLRYYDPKRGAAPNYTGNITEWEWAHPDLYMSGNFTPDAIMPDSCCYLYSYDNLSQLKNSQLKGFDPYHGSWMEMGTQGETQSYDSNGNITTLQRQDEYGIVDDNFTHTYTGNQLTTLKNNSLSYTYAYDANGSMTNDGLNALKLKYNCLTLVQEVSDLNNNLKAKYAYLADGTKLGVKDRLSRNGYEYYGSFRYAVVNGVQKLESVPYEGGRIIVSASGSGASMTYAYNINAYTADHLMSTRGAKYNVSDSAYEDYYSFGKGWENPAYSSNFDKYTYNGKEMQTTGWLPYLDYGARMYDPRIGRWFGPDPLAEKYYSTSPYAFCGNNPINFVDMFGLEPERVPGGFYDFANPGGSIDAVMVTGFSWRKYWRSMYASNYDPYVPKLKTVSTSISIASGGGGGGGGGRPSSVTPSFIRQTLLHYVIGFGTDLTLTKEDFDFLIKQGKITHPKREEVENKTYDAKINLYNSGYDLALSFGNATVYYTIKDGVRIYDGFKDTYDFNPMRWGERTWYNEWVTRLANKNIPGFGYEIKYP